MGGGGEEQQEEEVRGAVGVGGRGRQGGMRGGGATSLIFIHGGNKNENRP